jgi:putative methylase
MLNKKQLEIILSKLKGNTEPKSELEQYTIQSSLAAEILNLAYLRSDIDKRIVLDLGCGSGTLAIGAVLMDAKKVIGIDIDKNVLKIADENVKLAETLTDENIKDRIEFINKDISEYNGMVDTVIQNPPFGIQKLHSDRIFLKKAIESGKIIYSLHRSYSKSRIFIKRFVEENRGKTEKIIKFKFRLPYIFKFHKKPFISYDVDLFIISKVL